jgi:hypothetical protein
MNITKMAAIEQKTIFSNFEDAMEKPAIYSAPEQIFRTKTGTELLTSMFLN